MAARRHEAVKTWAEPFIVSRNRINGSAMTPEPMPLPDRPLTVKPPISSLRALWILLLCLAGAAGISAWLALGIAPSLASDYAIRDTAQPSATGRVTEGRCRSKVFLVTCDVSLSVRPDGLTQVTRDAHYFFVDLHSGDYDTEVMFDGAHPEWVTTQLGLEKLWNRIICAGLLVLAALAALFGGLRYFTSHLAAGRRLRRQFSGRRLRTVQAQLLSAENGTWVLEDGSGRKHSWSVSPKARPFFMPDGNSVLAVTPADPQASETPMVFPLDEELRWLDLTPPERAALQPPMPAATPAAAPVA